LGWLTLGSGLVRADNADWIGDSAAAPHDYDINNGANFNIGRIPTANDMMNFWAGAGSASTAIQNSADDDDLAVSSIIFQTQNNLTFDGGRIKIGTSGAYSGFTFDRNVTSTQTFNTNILLNAGALILQPRYGDNGTSGKIIITGTVFNGRDNPNFSLNIWQGLGVNSSIYINEFAIAQLNSTANHTSTIGAANLSWVTYRQSGTITIKTLNNGAGNNGAAVNNVTVSNLDIINDGEYANTKVVITGTGSYTGNTTVTAHGILILDGEADLGTSAAIQVQANSVLIHNAAKTVSNLSWESGGLIGGNGTFSQASFIGSGTHFINPGDIDGGIGKLNFSEAAYTWGGAGTELVYDWDFSDPTLGAGFDYDQLTFAGDLTLSADSYTLNLIGQNGATLDGFTGELAILTAAGTLSADLDNWSAVLPDGFELKLSDDGHSLLLSNIPEPSAWLLLGTGVALLAFLRRRR
jgi:hypothetical protein